MSTLLRKAGTVDVSVVLCIAETRTCNRCAEQKPLAEFHKDRTATLGHSWCCKACAVKRAKEWAQANGPRRRAVNATWKALHPDAVRDANARYRERNRERVRRGQKAYADRNADRIRARNREDMRRRRHVDPGAARQACRTYYWKNPEAMRERAREWARENPEKARANAYMRRARKKSAPVRERVYRSVVWRRDGGMCHICGVACDPARWDMDHVVPLSLGGEHSYANIKTAHPSCNGRKGARLLDERAEMAS